MRTSVIVITILLISCQQPETKTEKKTLDLGAFTIETPKEWKVIRMRGVDSYTGGIAVDLHDTIRFIVGNFSDNLTQYIPSIIYRVMYIVQWTQVI